MLHHVSRCTVIEPVLMVDDDKEISRGKMHPVKFITFMKQITHHGSNS